MVTTTMTFSGELYGMMTELNGGTDKILCYS